MKKIDPREIEGNFIKMIGQHWMLVTAGKPDDFNTMTASWGGVGELWNKRVAFVFIRPQRYTFEFTEREQTMTLSFFDPQYKDALQLCGSKSGRDIDKMAATGLVPIAASNGGVTFEQAQLTLECRKLYVHTLDPAEFIEKDIPSKIYPGGDFHYMYIVEITAAYVK